MAEISEFKYAYFNSEEAIIRIKIPMTLNISYEPEFEVVYFNESNPLPISAALLSHHHIVYMVGGHKGPEYDLKDSDCVYIFDPTKYHHYPANHIEPLYYSNFASVVSPNIFRVEDRIYLLSSSNYFCRRGISVDGPFNFLYFDPTQNLFETQPPPPFPIDRNTCLGNLGVVCHFYLRGYIYVFIREGFRELNAFKFNIKESKWEDCISLVDRFEEKNIPFPFTHGGDVGFSEKFDDNTWILVAVNGGTLLTAYRIRLCAKGDIDPISYRLLDECNISSDDGGHCLECDGGQVLVDVGGGRFCVARSTSMVDFLIYVFIIDFALEHKIQTSGSVVKSTRIIFSKKFNPDDIIPRQILLTGFCIASAPPASPDNEDQDGDDRKMKRKREE